VNDSDAQEGRFKGLTSNTIYSLVPRLDSQLTRKNVHNNDSSFIIEMLYEDSYRLQSIFSVSLQSVKSLRFINQFLHEYMMIYDAAVCLQ